VTEQEERDELAADARPDDAPSADPIESARHAQRNARAGGGADRAPVMRRPPGTAPGTAPPLGPSTAEIRDTTSWLLVADEGVARIFAKPRTGGDLEEVTQLTDEEAHAHRRDLRRDAYGRRAGADQRMGGNVTSSASDDELHREGAQFAGRVAQWLAQALQQKRYDDLRIAAAPRFLGQLRKALDKHVADLVVEEVGKDLTHANRRALTERFFPTPPPRTAA
jgi:protein required for attachment to host cells